MSAKNPFIHKKVRKRRKNSYIGVTNTSNWVIPNKLLMSAYPWSKDEKEQARVKEAFEANIDVIINLMEEDERLHLLLYGFTGIECIRVPTPDRRIASDETVDDLATDIIARIESGQRVAVHCYGGKGRSGVVCAIVLSRMKGLAAHEAIEELNKSFNMRENKGRRATVTEGWSVPQTKEQFEQVRRLIPIKRIIPFWGHRGRYGEFSNWYPSEFTVGGVEYSCNEQYMMAEKARLMGDKASLKKILGTKDPRKQKAFGRKVTPWDNALWAAKREEVMITGLTAKFGQNEELELLLLDTEDAILCESSPKDKIWGIGHSATSVVLHYPQRWKGLNLLGKSLMVTRDRLRKKKDRKGKGKARGITVQIPEEPFLLKEPEAAQSQSVSQLKTQLKLHHELKLPLVHLKLLTYNIWFEDPIAPRMEAIKQIIETNDPDVIALQEVTSESFVTLFSDEWFLNYSLCPFPSTDAIYFTIMAVRKSLMPEDFVRVPFNDSQMQRDIIRVTITVGGKKYYVGTSHLESTYMFRKERRSQLKRGLTFMALGLDDEKSDISGSIYMGDMNMRGKENEDIIDASRWTDFNPYAGKPERFTMDSTINFNMRQGQRPYRARLDRVYYTGDLEPVSLQRVGLAPIPKRRLHPSDHFGLLSVFEIS